MDLGEQKLINVLLVDEDVEFAKKVQDFLKEYFYEVHHCKTGKEAQLSIYNGKHVSVIINIATKNHSCLQVMKYIQLNCPSIKIIVLMEQVEYLKENDIEEGDLIKAGAEAVVYKAEDLKPIISAIEDNSGMFRAVFGEGKGTHEEEEVDCKDDDFTSIKIDEFYAGKAMYFDVYIRLKEDKYLKVLHAGDTFDKVRVDKYKDKGMEHLFFLNSDRIRYIRYTNYLAQKIIRSKTIDTSTKVNIAKNVVEKYCEEIYTKEFNPQSLSQSSEIANNMFEFVSNEKDLYKFMRDYQELDPNGYTHCFLTCLYSCLIIKQFKWTNETNLEVVTLASMLHDIGKTKLNPIELAKMRPEEMQPEELQEYMKHPGYGSIIIGANKKLGPTVGQVILQHHEKCDGSGFPYGIKKSKMTMLSRVVSFVNDFTHYIQEKELKPTEGLKMFLTMQGATMRYDPIVIEQFCHCFIDPLKIDKAS